jgi:hypothetical protein
MKSELEIIIRETVLARHGSDALLHAIANENLTKSQRTIICGWLADRLVAEGLEPNYEPNPFGLAIEAAIDEINRPNLERP